MAMLLLSSVVVLAVGFVIRVLIAIARALRQLRDHDSQL